MGISDVCFDFLEEIKGARSDADMREAVRNLQGAVAYYAHPPFRYGEEIDTLREACATYLLAGHPAGSIDEPLRHLAFVCQAIQEHLDLPPGTLRRCS